MRALIILNKCFIASAVVYSTDVLTIPTLGQQRLFSKLYMITMEKGFFSKLSIKNYRILKGKIKLTNKLYTILFNC